MSRLSWLLIVVAIVQAPAWAESPLTDERAAALERKITALDSERDDKVTLRIVPSHDELAGGETLLVGIDFRIRYGWHMYGAQKGKDYIPAKIQWQLPDGFEVVETTWSKTETEPKTGKPLYHRKARAIAKITAPKELPKGDIALHAKVSWQVCKEGCRVGALTMPITLKSGETKSSIFAPLLQAGPDR